MQDPSGLIAALLQFIAPWAFFAANVLTPGPNVLNTIGVAFGSGRAAAFGCAAACGVGVLIWAAAALLGAGAVFAVFPGLRDGMTVFGACVLLYFAYRYIRRAMMPSDQVAAIEGISPYAAFSQALLVLASNPKALTTWLAMLALFPVISASSLNMITFALGCGSVALVGHVVYATIFSTSPAARLYRAAVRPVNAAVGVGFTLYALKLLSDVLG